MITGNFDESMMENNQADTRGGNQLQPMSPVMHVRKQTDTTQIIQETGWQPATLLGHGINEPDPALRPPTPEDQGVSGIGHTLCDAIGTLLLLLSILIGKLQISDNQSTL